MILEADHVSAGYGKIEVLHDVSLAAEEGSIMALIGPNGSGKSTLLKALYGFLPIRSGKVTVSQILAHYRTAYAPAEGSPLIGSGDPADGKRNFVGAVGPGKDAPGDYFGWPQAQPLRDANDRDR